MLSFDDYLSNNISIDNSIGQGKPASMILYLIYSHRLIDIPQGPNEDGSAYVDDTFFVTVADNFKECNTTLNKMLNKQTA